MRKKSRPREVPREAAGVTGPDPGTDAFAFTETSVVSLILSVEEFEKTR
jgi:hypothetical protein